MLQEYNSNSHLACGTLKEFENFQGLVQLINYLAQKNILNGNNWEPFQEYFSSTFRIRQQGRKLLGSIPS